MSYFTIQDAEQFTFFRIPKVLFTGERYKDMTTDARVLYGILLDRVSLSVKNNWVDKEGRVFIIFTREEAQELLGYSKPKIVNLFKELHKVQLIEETKQGLSKPNLIYVKKFITENNTENNVQTQSNQQRLKFLTSRSKKNELQEVKKSDPIYTDDINNTYKNDIDNSVSQSVIEQPRNKKEPIGQTDRQTQKENMNLICKGLEEQLQLDYVKEAYPLDLNIIEDIKLNIFDMYFSDYTIIGGQKKPKELIRSVIMKLTYSHIVELISKYQDLSLNTKIKNTKSYIQTMIYNLAIESNLSVTNQVNYNMGIVPPES